LKERRLGIGKIRIEVLPGLSDFVFAGKAETIVLEREIKTGASVGELIGNLALEKPSFGEMIFDLKHRKLSGYVTVVLNDRLLESLDGLDTRIGDGDILRLFPVIAGG
jgi:molybdopterin converting factor small subunit